MKKAYETPLFEVLELIADESICGNVVSPGDKGDVELGPDDIL